MPEFTADNWVKGEQLGEGAHGTVYVVMHSITGEFFAVKESYLSCSDQETMKAMETELQFLQKLQHPNIVKYMGMLKVNNLAYIFQVSTPF